MITDIQKKKLNDLVGVPLSYNGKNINIEKVHIVSTGNVIIHSSGRVLCNLYPSEIDGFLNSLQEPLIKELSSAQVGVNKNELVVFEPTKENAEVKLTLMDTLRKVKEDPKYIPQAMSICNVVSQIVNVQKTEIQMLNLLNKKK